MSNEDFSSEIHHCVHCLRNGGVIAYPTEGVWGLGCDPNNDDAIGKILALKQRPASKGLILIAGKSEHFEYLLAPLALEVQDKIRESQGKHVTWLVPHENRVSPLVCGDSDKVAIRLSNHPVVLPLTEQFGGAIISTSANPAGKPSATERDQVTAYFSNDAIGLAPGRVGSQTKASTIIDADTGAIIRA